MKIKDKFNLGKQCLSFEVFPPKTSDNYESVIKATDEIAKLKPSFMSVTFGAGGGTSEYTVSIANRICIELGVDSVAHLTCASMNKEQVYNQLQKLKENGIENILALRGDIPEGVDPDVPRDFRYANELVEYIKQNGDFCIGGACYPEGHIESGSLTKDIENLKIKVDSGCDFLTTQMFFDNNILYRFLYRIREKGIDIPIVAGIMPVTNPKQIKRICALSGAELPARFLQIVDKFGDNNDAMQQAGIAYATEQIVDLYANGVNAVHVYSMNKPEVARKIKENLSSIVE